jgi:hypothetical protein
LVCSIKERSAKKSKGQVGSGNRAALQNNAMVETFTPTHSHDILAALKELEPDIIDYLQQQLKTPIKWYINMECIFKKITVDGEGKTSEVMNNIFQASKTYASTQPYEIQESIPEVFQTISGKFQEFQREGSGWILEEVVSIEVHTATYEPLVGSSYLDLPQAIAKTKCIINIQNKDDKCFLWSVLAHLHPASKDKNRVSKYKEYMDELDITGLSFPMKVSQVRIFERKNNLSINVFGYEEEKIVPVALSKTNCDTKINLLLISKEEQNHYCLITNFNGLMNRRTKCRRTMYYCFNCLHGFMRQDLLDKHRMDCQEKQTQRLTFPEDTEVKFKGIAKQQTVPFVIYADFECYTTKIDDGEKYQNQF